MLQGLQQGCWCVVDSGNGFFFGLASYFHDCCVKFFGVCVVCVDQVLYKATLLESKHCDKSISFSLECLPVLVFPVSDPFSFSFFS